MKKRSVLAIVSAITLILSVNSFGADTHSGQALEDAGKAVSHGSSSAGHALIGSGQVTSAASAVPLAVGGSAGAVATEIANDLMEAATAPIGTPLEITDESVTVGPPPDEALIPKKNKQEI